MKSNLHKNIRLTILTSVIGISLLITHYFIIENYNLNYWDLVGSILIITFIISELLTKQRNISFENTITKNISPLYYKKQNNKNSKPDIDYNNYITSESFIIRYNKLKVAWNLILILIAAIMIGVYLIDKKLYLLFAVLSTCYILGMYTDWTQLGENPPPLILMKNGFITHETGFIKWTEVKSVELWSTGSATDITNYLGIYLPKYQNWKKPECTFMIDHMDKSIDEIKKKLKELSQINPNVEFKL